MIPCQAQVSANCTGYAVHVHHRKRRSQGGDDSEANLLSVCVLCHNWIHHNVSSARALGLLVDSWNDPAEVPLSGIPGRPETDARPPRDAAECKRCKGSGQEPKVEKKPPAEKRKRKTWAVRVPDDAEDGAELLDSQLEQFKERWAEEMGWTASVPKYYPLYAAVFKANQEG